MTNPVRKSPNYQFNIRSFHPEEDFGWSGLVFEGDNRGFSNKPSGGLMAVTSRIWHRFTLNTVNGLIMHPLTRSDPSKAPWSDNYRKYDGTLSPTGAVVPKPMKRLNNGISHYRIDGQYGGVNHAMPGSPEMQEALGFSYVPTLDVRYKIVMDFDRVNKHVDIVTYISGDAFPNCEAFVVDGKGQSVFLGIHVRKGAAPVSLSLNLNFPMITCAIRLPVDNEGNFTGTIGDELARKNDNGRKLKFESINSWNQKFLQSNPNRSHCMALEKLSTEECF